MQRHSLSEKQWKRLKKVLPQRRTGPASTLGDRRFVDAVLYRAKTGMPWRDLPERFGPWKTVYNRFANWARHGLWEKIFKALQVEVDETGSIVDATIARAHQDASGGKGGSRATPWGAHVVGSARRSTRSSTSRAGHSTSR